MADRPRFLDRIAGLFGAGDSTLEQHVPPGVALVPTNGNGKHAPEAKARSGVTLSGFSFVPNGDGTANIVRLGTDEGLQLATAYALSAYAYVAMRYRAEKLAEPALMVIREDRTDSSEEWLPEHPAAPPLETPSPDFDMGELLYRTSLDIDESGACLWTMDSDRGGRPARFTPFSQREFTVEPTRDRIRGRFIVNRADGEQVYTPEQVIYFSEPNPHDWAKGLSRLDVAMRWLQLSESTRVAVRDLLNKSVWPSLVVMPDKEWNPEPVDLERYKQELALYGNTKGKPLVLLGGGTATAVAAQIKDLLPESLLNRVESIVSSVFGIPAIVLQFQVGMENAPWSQMEEARRMVTEDTHDPRWRMVERILTRQYLRRVDDDPTVFIKFDRSTIKGLQADRLEQAQLAQLAARDTSLNERRQLMGFDPRPEPEADEIEALKPPPPNPFAAFGGSAPDPDEEVDGAAADEDRDEDEDEEDEAKGRYALLEPTERAAARAAASRQLRGLLEGKARRGPILNPSAVTNAERAGYELTWRILAERNLETDKHRVAELAERILGRDEKGRELKGLDDEPSKRKLQRFFSALATYYTGESEPRWKRMTDPLTINGATREASGVLSTLGVRFDLVQPEIVGFALEQSATLVKEISETSREFLRLTVANGVENGESVRKIAQAIRDDRTFSPARAKLIARTETTKAQNGAAAEALKTFQARTGRVFEKVWETLGDGRVRDEHEAMQDERVPVAATFSNGLPYPSEPNCRCRARYVEVIAQ